MGLGRFDFPSSLGFVVGGRSYSNFLASTETRAHAPWFARPLADPIGRIIMSSHGAPCKPKGAQYPLTEECSLKDAGIPSMIEGILLN